MRTRYLAVALGVLTMGACKDATRPDLNNPSVTDFSTITDRSQVQNLVTGVVRADRGQNESEIVFGETIGRDLYRITGSEPRWITEMLGESIDASDFLGQAMWGTEYAAIRLANIGVTGINGADAAVLSDEEKQASLGVIRTMKALEYLRLIEVHDTTGAPINTDIDPTGDPAPLSCKGDVLAYVVSLLDSAAANLQAGGSEFPFTLPSGFAGFDDPAGFLKFNRALAAKANVELAFRNYAKDGSIDKPYLTTAQTALTASFMVRDAGKLEVGPFHTYSTNSGDATNGLFDITIRANPRVVAEADAGDDRVTNKTTTTTTVSVGGDAPPQKVSSNVAYTLYDSPTAPVSILTNKELLLLQAEIFWGQGDMTSAMDFANFIRTTDGGLTAKVGLIDSASVLNQILYEKRYSLLEQSGARWVDSRMFGRLNGSEPPAGVGKERGLDPLNNFPMAADEVVARNGNVSITSCTVN